MKVTTVRMNEHDAENVAVGLALNPHIASQADLIRSALEVYIEMSADAPQIERARKAYRKTQKDGTK